jgi:hypothetical protein
MDCGRVASLLWIAAMRARIRVTPAIALTCGLYEISASHNSRRAGERSMKSLHRAPNEKARPQPRFVPVRLSCLESLSCAQRASVTALPCPHRIGRCKMFVSRQILSGDLSAAEARIYA